MTAGELYATGAALDEMSQQIRTEIGALHAQISWAVEAIWRITAIASRISCAPRYQR
jgi:hypothetical protein